MKKHILMMGVLIAALSTTVQAEKSSEEELEALSAEASETDMQEVEPSERNEIEPEVEPSATTEDINELSETVAKKLSGILGSASPDNEEETENKLEKVVSSALLEGAKMDDLRAAVSEAMSALAESEESDITAEKVGKATQTLDKLIGQPAEKESTESFRKAQQEEAEEYATSLNQLTKEEIKEVLSGEHAHDENHNNLEAEPLNEPLPDTVVVQTGDSLYKIALRVYGDGYSFVRLYEANKDIIADPNIVRVGQVLKVPHK